MKTVLFIEDDYIDFDNFSKIFESNGFLVYPKREDIIDGIKLTSFLGKEDVEDYQKLEGSIIKKIFDYINEKNLYEQLSLIILDINLYNKDDLIGLSLLSSLRSDFNPKNSKYKHWNKTIPVIALTDLKIEKYQEMFKNHPGYLLGFHAKDSIRNSNEPLLRDMNNFHEQMSAIYPLFYDPELKQILSKIKQQGQELKDIKSICKLILNSEIAQMDIDKRNLFIQHFTAELIKYTRGIDGFMGDVEQIEQNFKKEVQCIFDLPSIKLTQFISSIFSLLSVFVKPEAVPPVFEKFIDIFSNFTT
jgi:CheY-like chemotaxis protein